MFAMAGVQEASSLHDYAISLVILVFLPPFVLCCFLTSSLLILSL
jgi:hypothetical protein